jgi:hypothetical protein
MTLSTAARGTVELIALVLEFQVRFGMRRYQQRLRRETTQKRRPGVLTAAAAAVSGSRV